MIRKLVYLFVLLQLRCLAAVPAEWYERLAQLESSDGQFLVGDGGRSRGWYHMGKAAWLDTTARRQAAKLPVIDWRTGSRSKQWCDIYAKDHVAYLAKGLSGRLGHCSQRLIYAAWNAGLDAVVRADGNLNRLPRATKARALLFPGELMFVANK